MGFVDKPIKIWYGFVLKVCQKVVTKYLKTWRVVDEMDNLFDIENNRIKYSFENLKINNFKSY